MQLFGVVKEHMSLGHRFRAPIENNRSAHFGGIKVNRNFIVADIKSGHISMVHTNFLNGRWRANNFGHWIRHGHIIGIIHS